MTTAAMMKATSWQQHPVCGCFAGVVQKKLRIKLNSKKIGGNRTRRDVGAGFIAAWQRSGCSKPSHGGILCQAF
jgi:hypothetical protein